MTKVEVVGAARATQVDVLGPLQVTSPAGPVTVGAPKQRALLVLLALGEGRPVRAADLVSGLWGDDPPRSASKTLQMYISGLRQLLGDGVIRTTPGGYELVIERKELDANRFEDLVEAARRAQVEGRSADAIRHLVDALALWRGPALVDVGDRLVGVAAGSRLDELHRTATEDLSELRLGAGQHQQIIADLEAAVSAEPLRERRWGQLILGLYRCGRQADALRTYQRLRDLLGDELGIEPSTDLVRLEQSLLVQAPELQWSPPDIAAKKPPEDPGSQTPPTASGRESERNHNLPYLSTSFVGRDEQVGEISGLIESAARLITLTGTGGVGKTRLALEVASGLLDGSGDGVWLVELAPVSDPANLADAVLRALGLREDAELPGREQVVEFLRPKRALIVLDNCEHIVGPTAELAELIMRACPEIWILATSREPLGIDGEQLYRVPSLSLPGPDGHEWASSEAVRLFAARAALHRPGFVVDESNREAVVSICRRVDGIPLAIELAAARMRSLSVHDIHARIGDRLRLLTGGNRTALPRQQTLRGLIDWSHDLLSTRERLVFRRLSVFVGGFDLDAAESVLSRTGLDPAEAVDLVLSLVDKSLIQVEATEGASARYRMVETIRQYSAERLVTADGSEAEETRAAHADSFANLARAASSHLEGPGQVQWLRRLDTDSDNLRTAFACLVSRQPVPNETLELADNLRYYLYVLGRYKEGAQTLRAALDAVDKQAPAPLRSSALIGLAVFERSLGSYDAANRSVDEGLDIARRLSNNSLLARGLRLRSVLMPAGPERKAVVDSALSAARAAGDLNEAGRVLLARASATHAEHAERTAAGHPTPDDIGRGDAFAAYQNFKTAGNLLSVPYALNNLANSEFAGGDLDNAERHLLEAKSLAENLDLETDLPYICESLGMLLLLRGDPASAQQAALEALPRFRRAGDNLIKPAVILVLALAASSLGRPEEAAFLHGAADRIITPGAKHDVLESRLREADLLALRDHLGPERFEAGYGRGLTVSSFDRLVSMIDSAGDAGRKPAG